MGQTKRGPGASILAIDPGTNCGWARVYPDGLVLSGVWDLGVQRHEGGGMRFVRLMRELDVFARDSAPIELVAYEEVHRHLGTHAAHVYGGITATLTSWCERQTPPVPYTGLPVGTVKKHATGKGNAGKDQMVGAAQAKWPLADITSDDEADAMWILDLACEMYGQERGGG